MRIFSKYLLSILFISGLGTVYAHAGHEGIFYAHAGDIVGIGPAEGKVIVDSNGNYMEVVKTTHRYVLGLPISNKLKKKIEETKIAVGEFTDVDTILKELNDKNFEGSNNWTLPSEELLGLIVKAIGRGNMSLEKKGAYWGSDLDKKHTYYREEGNKFFETNPYDNPRFLLWEHSQAGWQVNSRWINSFVPEESGYESGVLVVRQIWDTLNTCYSNVASKLKQCTTVTLSKNKGKRLIKEINSSLTHEECKNHKDRILASTAKYLQYDLTVRCGVGSQYNATKDPDQSKFGALSKKEKEKLMGK